jgi:hypothetical protein
MRKVKVLKVAWTNGKRELVDSGIRAYFHAWGMFYEEFDSGPGNYSTAIIEHENGKVESVECELVQFIEPFSGGLGCE